MKVKVCIRCNFCALCLLLGLSLFQFLSPCALAEQLTLYLREKFCQITKEELVGKESIGLSMITISLDSHSQANGPVLLTPILLSLL
jgi:hypothetical protein